MHILKPTSIIMNELLEAIRNAKKEILLQTFYIDNDVTATQFIDLLITKASEGVRVYCLIDALGGNNLTDIKIEKKLKDNGVHVEFFNWLTPWKGKSKKIWYFRNHKRALLIDNMCVHVGGWCIGDKTLPWIDCHFVCTDIDVIANAVTDFWQMYTYSHKTKFTFSGQKKYVYSNTDYSYSHQAPLLRSRYIYYTHKKLLTQTRDRIILVSPYFTPTHTLLHQIRKARKRGVSVDVILPRKTDHTLVDLVAKTYISNLLAIGVRIFFSNTMVHAKICVFDTTAFIGTMNLDIISLRYNFENGIYINNKNTVDEIIFDIEELKTTCTQIDQDAWNKRSTFEMCMDVVMKVFRPFV